MSAALVRRAEKQVDFTQKQSAFEVVVHPQSRRLYQIRPNQEILKAFFQACADTPVQRLNYVAFERFAIAERFRQMFGVSLADVIFRILNDRFSGGFILGVEGTTIDRDDFIKLSTAITHMIGVPTFDRMSGNYYATFAVEDMDESDSYLRQAYRTMALHTDGAYEDRVTEWILMMKLEEKNAIKGNSRLMHLDDWEELDKFSNHPLASQKVMRLPAKSKNVDKPAFRPTFFWKDGYPCIIFAEQNIKPATLEQGLFFKQMCDSIEGSEHIVSLRLPPGNLVMVNNHYWLHGREKFEKHPQLYRELLRQRGNFYNSIAGVY